MIRIRNLRRVRAGASLALLVIVGTASRAFAAPTPSPATAVDAPPPGSAAAVNKGTPEFEAFRKAWVGVENYAGTIVAHETSNDGKLVQDRTYRYTFVKPNAALIVITAGPGKGGGAAWHGGATVHGHKGGLVSFVKLTLPKNDPRVTSLRGDQIEVASFGYELDRFSSTKGTLAESKTAAGIAVDLTLETPDATGVTREILTLSPTTHLPVKHEAFAGDREVKNETFSDLKLNDPTLKASELDI